MFVDIFTREPKGERPHVHISRTPRHGKWSLKIYCDDDVRIADGCTGRYTPQEIKDALLLVIRNRELLLNHWASLHGLPKKRTSRKSAKKTSKR